MPQKFEKSIEAVMPQVIQWRRDIHEHPELSNRELRTSKLVAEHLKSLGIDVRTGVAHTGVVGVLKGGKPGPVIALRADMDALPVVEQVDVPFASKVRTTYDGHEVGVMHACGHDTHVAILMGVAKVLAENRAELPGTIVFLFQPAEEGAPAGEEGGAELMVKEGALRNPRPEVVFGLHVSSLYPVGTFALRPGSLLAAVDSLHISVHGKQTHGAYPWRGVDPIVVSSQIILGLQTIPSRQLDSTIAPAIVTIGEIHGGVRNNIIPDDVEMEGTLRSLDDGMRNQIHERVKRTAERIAESAGATADVKITPGYPVTYNDPALTGKMMPVLKDVADEISIIPPVLGAEDFSFFAKEVPGLFFFIGVTPKGENADEAAPNHSPRFYVDESGLVYGVRAMTELVLNYGNRG